MKDFLKKYGENMRKEISKEDYNKLYPGMAEMFKQPFGEIKEKLNGSPVSAKVRTKKAPYSGG